MRHSRKVMIIGAGTGGLCLAHGLKADGIDVEIFERDYSPVDHQQGFRLSISAIGSAALRSCLPPALFDKLAASCADPSRGVTFLDHRLNRLLAIDFPHSDREDADAERPVSRTTLRRILLEGLGGVVRFGKKFTAFEDGPNGSVVARFADGSAATGDVLIGADGAGSRLRSQLLPDARRVETGITAVSGKIGLNDAIRGSIPQPILRGPTPILGSRGCFMFASAVQFRDSKGNSEPARDHRTSDEQEEERGEYVMWGFSAHRAKFAPADLEGLGGEDLKASVLVLMPDWHPSARWLVQMADASTVSAFAVKTSVPISPWQTRNVTLLGDALHNMTPFRGIGANTALRDAAALRRALVAFDRGEQALIPALVGYERDMIEYGFSAVRTSLADMERFHSERGLSRALTKAAFRAADWIPPLKTMFLGGR
jgi:2-polyprenyl-6-methoxyphenol hydroxylase-like FAD-dependent oxidoreductase